MNERVLQAYINDVLIGTLHEANGLWGFQYSHAWLETPNRYALSPQLPLTPNLVMDGATQRPVQWYFDNLLPEEGQRSLLAADAKIDRADAFGLLAYYGAESAGSLTLVLPDAPAQLPEPLRPLPDEALHARIQQLPRAPLTHSAVKRMSLAGATKTIRIQW
jgi:serine/threonine-protein kinase HipA